MNGRRPGDPRAARSGRAGGDGGRGPGGEARRGAGRPGGGTDERARAIALLIAVERGAFAAELLDAGDGRFVRELVLGVLRRRLTLDAVCDVFGRRALLELDDDVRAALRIGLYQLFFMDGVPPHAAVSATVGALRSGAGAGGAGARAYVNALLRAVQRESHRVPEAEDRGGASPRKRLHRPGRCVIFFSRPVFPDPEVDRAAWLAAVHSHPRLLVERWVASVGEEAAVARMEAGNAPAPLVLRPRLGRLSPEALAQRLMQEGVVTELLPRAGAPAAGGGDTGPARTDALLVRSGADRALAGRAFRDGLFAVQDPEQMDAAEILDPRAGESVWDACAAPGGKTAQLAELLALAEERVAPARPEAAPGGASATPGAASTAYGRILATDASEERLARLHETLERLGLRAGAEAAVANPADAKVAGAAVADASVESGRHDLLGETPPPGRPAAGFDAILLDAPCSNTAVLARRPEARWRLHAESFAELAALQRRLLAAAHAHLAPHGRLVYSVCTHEPEEGAGHGLRATRSPFVWTATHAELGARVADWARAGLLAAPAARSASAGAAGDAGAARPARDPAAPGSEPTP